MPTATALKKENNIVQKAALQNTVLQRRLHAMLR
jgi:hypothetical protein